MLGGKTMRAFGILFAGAAVMALAAQSFVSGVPQSDAVSSANTLTLAELDICEVDVATRPVMGVEEREVVTAEAYSELTVIPATFGSVTEKLTIVPAHREGATFFTEQERVIVSEPTRQLRAVPAKFDTVPAVSKLFATDYQVQGGELLETETLLDPIPDMQIVLRKAEIHAVRVNAGLEMHEVQVIDKDGDGKPVPATTIDYERRTVESHPKVETKEIPEKKEVLEIGVVKVEATRTAAPALCSVADRADIVRAVQAALVERGFSGIEANGEWDAATVDAMALVQLEETGFVSPSLLLETLPVLLPDLAVPTA